MKRLRDSETESPLHARAKALLEAAPPIDDSPARMRRVFVALEQRAQASRQRPGFGFGLGRLRVPVLASVALVALGGTGAFAAVRVYEALSAPSVEPSQPQPDASRKSGGKPRRVSAKAVAVAPEATPSDSNESSAPNAPSVVPSPSKPHPARVQATADAQGPATLAEATESSELVHRALAALRRDRDPALAAALLEQHRARTESGPLAEESLALLIEAYAALGKPRARVLAKEYLARYPNGRYAQAVLSALSDTAP